MIRWWFVLVVGCFVLWPELVSGQPTPRVDSYGDPLPPGALARLGTVRWRHEAGFTALAFAPHGNVLACAAGDHSIRLLDADSGKVLHTLFGHTGRITALSYHAGGTLLASTGEDHTLRRWNAATGKPLSVVPLRLPRPIALSPDGTIFATRLVFNTVYLQDAVTGKELCHWEAPGEVDTPLLFSPDGKMLATADHATVYLWKVETGTLFRKIPGRGGVLAFSTDGKHLAIAWDRTEPARLTPPLRPIKMMLQPPPPKDSFSPPWMLRLMDITTGLEKVELEKTDWEQSYKITKLVFAPNGMLYAYRGFPGDMQRWSVVSGKVIPFVTPFEQSYLHASECWSLTVDGKTMATVDYHGSAIKLWNMDTGKQRNPKAAPNQIPHALVFSRDGKTLVSAGDGIRVWETQTAKLTRFLTGYDTPFSCTDGRILLVSGNIFSGTTVRDLETNKIILKDKGNAPDFSPVRFQLSVDGKMLVVHQARYMGGLADSFYTPTRLVHVSTGKEIRRWESEQVVGISPDGKTVGIFWGNVVRICDTLTGKERLTLPGQRTVNSTKFSPCGKRIITNDWNRLRLWDITAETKIDFPAPCGLTVFTNDGRLLITGDADGVIRFWETDTGKVVHTIAAHRLGVRALALSSDHQRVATAGGDTAILLWDLSRFWAGSANGAPQAVSDQELTTWWTALAGEDGVLAYRAIGRLSAAGLPAVTFLMRRLQPKTDTVTERLSRLIAQLGDPKFAVRTQATRELQALHYAAKPTLKAALQEKWPLEIKRRLEKLLELLPEWRPPVFLSETLRKLRAIQVLERIGTGAACALLTTLGQGSALARETQEAQAALERLRGRS